MSRRLQTMPSASSSMIRFKIRVGRVRGEFYHRVTIARQRQRTSGENMRVHVGGEVGGRGTPAVSCTMRHPSRI